MPQSKKWSSNNALFTTEGITTRLKVLALLIEELKMAGGIRENPGFEYLQDDPALQIVIKKLLVKFPQWGIACVNGVLVN
ncbi:MAG: hypothetical protein KME50_21600 [Nostoc desertorum CM1-VF14]|nr:hypothetical protein [Nostoc desertorum CM1-VF14]